MSHSLPVPPSTSPRWTSMSIGPSLSRTSSRFRCLPCVSLTISIFILSPVIFFEYYFSVSFFRNTNLLFLWILIFLLHFLFDNPSHQTECLSPVAKFILLFCSVRHYTSHIVVNRRSDHIQIHVLRQSHIQSAPQ